MGNKDRKGISAVPPCLQDVLLPLIPVPTHRLPVNAGNASIDTEGSLLVPLALGGPFTGSLFAPLSAVRNSLWMRLRLYPRLCGFPFS